MAKTVPMPLADDPPAAPAANPHRGEIAVMLDARYVLRPTFEAVAAIESSLGSVMDLARRVAREPYTMTRRELAVIVTEGMRAWGQANNDTNTKLARVEKVERLIFAAGMPSVLEPVGLFLMAAITGGANDEGEAGNA